MLKTFGHPREFVAPPFAYIGQRIVPMLGVYLRN